MQGAQLGHPVSVLLGHTGPVTFIDFCRTVHYALVSSSYDGTCRLWNATTSGPALHVLPISATFGPMHGVTRFGGGSQPSGLAGANGTVAAPAAGVLSGPGAVTGTAAGEALRVEPVVSV